MGARKVQAHLPKNYFKWQIILARLLGVQIPGVENNVLAFFYYAYAVWFLGVFIYLLPVVELLELIDKWGDIEVMSFNIAYLLTHTIGVYKVNIFLKQRKTLWEIFQRLERGHFKPNIDRGGLQEIDEVKQAIRLANIQFWFWFMLVPSVVLSRSIPIYFERGQPFDYLDPVTNVTEVRYARKLPYSTWAPFNYEDREGSISFELFLTYQIITLSAFGYIIGPMDSTIAGLMGHVTAQFNILALSIRSIRRRALSVEVNGVRKRVVKWSPGHIEEFTENSELVKSITNKLITECVVHHLDIFSLAEEVEGLFNIVLLAQFGCSLILICFQLYQFSLVTLSSSFFSACMYLAAMLFQLFYFCYHGNEVQLASVRVAEAVYDSEWHEMDVSNQRSLLLIMQRALKPFRFSAGKFSYLTLETFVNLLRGSGSYFMVLRQQADRNKTKT